MLDPRDRRILALLQTDADTPVTTIAERVGLSVSACSRRIQRLRDDGTITRSVAVLDRQRMGVPTTVFVLIRSGRHAADWVDAFRAAIADVPEIVEAHRLTGNFDYLLKLVLPNVEHYDVVYKRLTRKLELFDVAAYISMETLKAELALPTDHAV
jgi:Lrp/AsnC family transcriptional regulator